MSGGQRAGGLLEHDVGPLRAGALPRSEGPAALPPGGAVTHAALGEGQVLEEVEDYLDQLVAGVADKVEEPAAAERRAVHDEDMANLRDLLDNLLDDNSQLGGQPMGQPMAQPQSPFGAADVCQQTGDVHAPGPTEEGAGCADQQALRGAEGGGAAGDAQRSPRTDEEPAAIDADAPAAPALADDDGGRQRRARRKGRTASRTRRRKQRTARSRSTRSSHSRSSRSRDDEARATRSRSRHKHKHKRRRRRHRDEPLTLSVDNEGHTEGPVSPRVNPVFLWVKQEECRILSVVCEDYDRRNRITLTKTTNGWRSIPKTELFSAVLGPRQRPSLEDDKSHTASSAEGEAEEEEADEGTEAVRPEARPEVEPAEAHLEGSEGEESPADDDANHQSDEIEDTEGADEGKEMAVKGVADVRGDDERENEEKMEAETGVDKGRDAEEGREENGEDKEADAEEGIVAEEDVREAEDGDIGPEKGEEKEVEGDETRENAEVKQGEAEENREQQTENVTESREREEEMETELPSQKCTTANEPKEPVETDPHQEQRLPTPSPPPSLVAKDTAGEPCLEYNAPTKDVHSEEERPEDVLDALCNEAAEAMEVDGPLEDLRTPKAELKAEPKAEPKAEAKQEPCKDEDKAAGEARPCSVYDLLSLDETEHVVRLPADLEVSLVKEVASTSPAPPQLPPPQLEPLRLGAATTITPVSEQPAKPQHKFLESLLASPRKSDLEQEAPLDLGVPVRQAKDRPRTPPPSAPPAAKRPKLDDLTLRNLLNRLPGNTAMSPVDPAAQAGAQPGTEDVKRIKQKRPSQDGKSRLMELLTDLDPLAQLKQVLSDPDLVVPDPLLVPRARLQALVTSPAQEIPRLLAQKPERVPYAAPNNDLCVVSLSHLQTLLQPESKQALAVEEYQRQLLEAQMLWLPYLEAAYSYPGGYLPGYDYKSQMELQNALATAWQETMLKGGGIDTFINNNNYKKQSVSPQPPKKSPSPMPPPSPRHQSAGYASAPALAAASQGFAKPAPPPAATPPPRSRPVPAALPIAAASAGHGLGRDSPALFAAPQRPYQYQQQQQQRREYEKQQQQQQQRREYEKQQQQQQQQQRREYEKQQEYHQQLILLQQLQLQQEILAQQQRQQQMYAMQQPMQQPRGSKHGESERSADRARKSEGSRPPTCKSLLNMLSAQREAQQAQHREAKQRTPSPAAPESALLAALGSPLGGSLGLRGPRVSPGPAASPTSSAAASSSPVAPAATSASSLPGAPVLDLSGSRRPSSEGLPSPAAGGGDQPDERKRPPGVPKLKVKNLVDPNAKPRLLKLDTPVVPPPAVPPDDVSAAHLWHPLFSSQKSSYNSPWQWTTVTVNGE